MCGCGTCGGGCGSHVPVTIERQRSWADTEANAVMCALCLRAAAGDCPQTGQPADIMAFTGGCPIGRHPDAAGLVRWLRVRWMGVPAPIRWAWPVLRRWLGLPPLSGPLPGCGCLLRSKAAWTQLRAAAAWEPAWVAGWEAGWLPAWAGNTP